MTDSFKQFQPNETVASKIATEYEGGNTSAADVKQNWSSTLKTNEA